MAKRQPDPSVFNLRPKGCDLEYPSPVASKRYWEDLQEHRLVLDIVQPDGIDRADIMRAFLSLYAYIPEARPGLLDAISKTHGYQECFEANQRLVFALEPMTDHIAEAMEDIHVFCEQGGATRVRGFDLTWKNATSQGLESLLQRSILKHHDERSYWRSLTLTELERWYPLFAARQGFPDLEVDKLDWKQLRSARLGQIYGMVKNLEGVERAVALSARGLKYDLREEASWLPLEDVVQVFGNGSLDTLLALPQEGAGQFVRKVSKLAIGLASNRIDAVDLFKGCDRSTLTYWRKAGYIDQLTWYRVLGATSKQVDTMMARDIGL